MLPQTQHANTLSIASRGSATICLFYRDLGARWLTTTAGGGHRKRKTIERGIAIGGFLRGGRGAPALNMDWRGLWRWERAACTVSSRPLALRRLPKTFRSRALRVNAERGPSRHQCRSHGTRRAALGCAVKHTDHSRQCRAFVAPRRPATAASRRKNRPHRQHDHPPAGRPTRPRPRARYPQQLRISRETGQGISRLPMQHSMQDQILRVSYPIAPVPLARQ